MSENVTPDEVIALVMSLPPLEKIRLMEQLAASLQRDLAPKGKKPKRSSRGLLADLGPAPSAEDIDEARREMWAGFPREEFFE